MQTSLFPHLAAAAVAAERPRPVSAPPPALRKGVDYAPSSGSEVYVVSESGELIEGRRFALGLAKAHAEAGAQDVEGRTVYDSVLQEGDAGDPAVHR